MYKYYYEKLNLSDNNEETTSSEDFDNYNNNKINYNLSNKKLKIKYIYTHYTNYTFNSKTSK